MKRSRLARLALLALAALGLLAWLANGREPAGLAHAQAILAPQECVCSAPFNLAPPGASASWLRNCQCGAMQCVVHVGSGALQCR